MTEPIRPDAFGPPHPTAFRNRWAELTFLHWAYDPDTVQRLLPAGLRVDTHDDRAWVALVPFRMEGVRPRWAPPVPWLSTFCETNVRTYVTDAAGNRGVYFFSLDATRLAVVAGARLLYGVPYVWSTMSLARAGDLVTYTCRRRFPGPRGAVSEVVVRWGDELPGAEAQPLLAFLTARWATLTGRRGMVRRTPVAHERWRLRSAELLHLRDDLVGAAGLPPPQGPPLVHGAETVHARIGRAAAVPS